MKQVEHMLEQGDFRGLARALRDSNMLVRRRAAQALGELKQAEAVPALARALQKDKDQYVIRWSVESLKSIADPAAVDVLTWAAFEGRRSLSAPAAQALSAIPAPEAAIAARVREAIARNELDALQDLGPEAARALDIVIRGRQFATWAYGKRKLVLTAAVRAGVKPPSRFRRDLIDMGLFVSGVHTLGDLLFGLGHRSAPVRIAAAERLSTTDQRWTTLSLNSRFRRELGPGGDRKVAVAMARAMSRLGDRRGHDYYKRLLLGPDMHAAAEAARALGQLGTPEAIQTLFWFVVKPPPPPAYHNLPVVLAALESAGPAVYPVLEPLRDQDDRRLRLILVQTIVKCGHPDVLAFMAQAAHDPDPDVQHAAIDALAELNTSDAATALYAQRDVAPTEWLMRALAAITQPAALGYLKSLQPDTTALYGVVLEDNGKPLPGAYVQVVREHFFGENVGWGWMPVSARAQTDLAGEFAMAVLDDGGTSMPRLKVTTPASAEYRDSATFLSEMLLTSGQDNRVRVRVDRFFSRLII
jgi:HEAT repeat protein